MCSPESEYERPSISKVEIIIVLNTRDKFFSTGKSLVILQRLCR